MMNIKSLLWPQIIFRSKSSYNPKIEVVEFLGKKSLRCGGLTQSGSIVEDIYKKIIHRLPYTVNRTQHTIYGIQNALVLGLGAGTIIKLLTAKYPDIKIIGVEIDPEIIIIGKTFFGLQNGKNLRIIKADAVKYLHKIKNTAGFDLIFVDLYLGEKINPKISDNGFLSKIKKITAKNGVVVFNKINFRQHKFDNEVFIKKIKAVFDAVAVKKSYSNLLIFCINN